VTGIVLSFGAAVGLGFGLWLWLRPEPRGRADALLGLSIAIPLGLGLASLGFFVWFILLGLPPGILLGAEIALGAPLIVTGARAGRGSQPTPRPQRGRWSALDTLLGAGCLVGIALAAYGFLCRSIREPHGLWDAWAIWNLKARFLFRGGDHWQEALSPLLSWSHPDYPLMIPGLIARGWTFSGQETTAIPVATGFLFTLATVGILTAALWRLRGRSQGFLAGLVLIGTPFFVAHGAAQYAEIPLAAFMVASLALLHLGEDATQRAGGLHCLAGLLAGMAAWTKNEGLLFVLALAAAQAITMVWMGSGSRDWRRLAAFCAGALPVMLLVVGFKGLLAPASDLWAGQGLAATLGRLADPSRYLQVARAFAKVFLDREKWNLFPVVLPFYALLVGAQIGMSGNAGQEAKDTEGRPGVARTWGTLALTTGGFFLVYLVTPRDLAWHLRTSADRVFLQLWPGLLLATFLSIGSPSGEEPPHDASAKISREPPPGLS
jgi:hypothetical protein